MNDSRVIMLKEFARFFSSRVSAFATILLPGLLMATLYTAMGSMEGVRGPGDDDVLVVVSENTPSFLQQVAQEVGLELRNRDVDVSNPTGVRERIEAKEFDAVVRFPKDFESLAMNFGLARESSVPNVEVYYDASNMRSASAFKILSNVLDAYESRIANVFDVNAGGTVYEVGDKESSTAKVIGKLFPALLLLMLFQSILAIAAESIAGEKERGTLATVLATPVRRASIVWGKLAATAAIGILAAVFSVSGLIVGFRNMSGGEMQITAYGVREYALVAAALVPFALIAAVLAIVISALAKTTKEAQIYLTAIQILIAGSAVIVGLIEIENLAVGYYFLPFFNSALVLSETLSLSSSMSKVLLVAVVNMLCAIVGTLVATRIMNSERFMFQR